MVDIEKVIKGLENCSTTDGNCQWAEHPDCPYLEDCTAEKYSALDRDALELLKDYKQHLQNDLETLKEEKRRLELEHEAKAFIYKEKEGLITIKISN